MKGKFDEQGILCIERGALGYVPVVCMQHEKPGRDSTYCECRCSLLAEPVENKTGVVLAMCTKLTHFESFTDERELTE